MRVSRLHGPTGSLIAAFVEEHQRREDLAGAAIRFRLTRREVPVLELILGGHSAVEIAVSARAGLRDGSGRYGWRDGVRGFLAGRIRE